MALDKLIAIGAPLGAWQSGAREVAPDGAAEQVVGLLGDDGLPFKRGGSTYKSNAALGAAGLLWVASLKLAAGERTVFGSASAINVLGVDDVTPAALVRAALETTDAPAAPFRPVVIGPYAPFWTHLTANPLDVRANFWGGTRRLSDATNYSTGTVAVTQGSPVIKGTGTAWVGNVQVGDVIAIAVMARNYAGVVKSVDSNTQITLTESWPDATASGLTYGSVIALGSVVNTDFPGDIGGSLIQASVGGRWVVATANIVRFSGIITGLMDAAAHPLVMGTDDFHSFPATIVGLASLRDSLMVFTQAGVYAVSNMAYDLVDAVGNPQQRIDLINADLIAWTHEGIASWGGALVVPALDNVWLMDGIGAPIPIGTPILDLYLSYIAAGYRTGVAEVFDGHYLLPILTASNTWVDTLVCRMRPPRGGEGPAWTQLAGDGAQVAAFTERPSSPPALLGASRLAASRVLDVTGYFAPTAAGKLDATGTTPSFSWTTRAFSTGNMTPNFVSRVRARYVLTDAAADNPTVTCEASIDGAAFTTLSRSDGSGTTAPESDGSSTYSWTVGRRARDVRLRFTVSGPSAACTFRTVEVFLRHSGKY